MICLHDMVGLYDMHYDIEGGYLNRMTSIKILPRMGMKIIPWVSDE